MPQIASCAGTNRITFLCQLEERLGALGYPVARPQHGKPLPIHALAVQSWVIAHDHPAVGPVLPATVGASAIGIGGAKVWYIAKHQRTRRFEGWCIQGFLTGATGAAVLIFTVLQMPTSTVLDATTPGLMLGLALGQVGCFFAGCCGGPPTASRWGVWSSDQRVGARRAVSPPNCWGHCHRSWFLLGLVALVAVLSRRPA